jgi:hypothetical protein
MNTSSTLEEKIDLPVDYTNLTTFRKRLVRAEYIKQQEGKCWYCGCSLRSEPRKDIKKLRINKKLFPVTFFQWPIHLHHDHKTNMTIGVVHNHCNAVLWQYHGQ